MTLRRLAAPLAAAALASAALRCSGRAPPAAPPPAPAPPRVDVGAELAAARAALADGRPEEARAHLDRAVAANPRAVEPRLDLAELLVSGGGDLALAARLLDEARAVRPEDARLERLRGAVAELSGDEGGAAAAYARSLALEGDPELRLRRGLLLARAGRSAEALEELERVRAERPGSRAALAALATLHEAAGRAAEAEADLRELARLAPADPAPRRALAELYRRRGEEARAAEAEDEARRLEGKPRALRPLRRSRG